MVVISLPDIRWLLCKQCKKYIIDIFSKIYLENRTGFMITNCLWL